MAINAQWRRVSRGLALAAAGLALAALTGCMDRVKSADERELDDPYVERAVAKEHDGDIEGAIRLYREALDHRSTLARAHLGLALLLDAPDRDYVEALYHYRRYLALRPRTEKKAMIEDRMRMAKIAFAGALLRDSPGVVAGDVAGMQARIGGLQVANSNLQAQLRQMHLIVDQRRVVAPGPTATGAGGGARSGGRTYHVEPGDTLTKIAAKVYGDPSRWKDILAANRPMLQRSDDLRMGQVITIPR